MLRKLLFGLLLAGGINVYAQSDGVIPFNEIAGDYIIMNSEDYEGQKMLADVRNMTFTLSEENDSILISGLYMNKCPDVKAGYDETNGNITIPAGTVIFYAENVIHYLYPWDDDAEEVNYRPIVYKYNGDGSWSNPTTLMVMAGYVGGELSPYYFAQGSEIKLSNSETSNVSYAGIGSDQQMFDEKRPSFMQIDGSNIMIYNLLTTDQFGFGCNLSGSFDKETGECVFVPAVVGQANDGTYKVLAGCGVDEENNIPTGITNPDTSLEGDINAVIDFEKGTIHFDPMCIFPASLGSDGYLVVDDQSFFELVKSVDVTFKIDEVVSVENVTNDDENMEIKDVEYYSLEGIRIAELPEDGKLVIRKINYKDNTSKVEKVIVNE